MAVFTKSGEQEQRTNDEVLASKGRDWSCVTTNWDKDRKNFRLDLDPNDWEKGTSLFLTLGCGDFEGLSWVATFTLGATSLNGTEQRGQLIRKFSVNDRGADPISNDWSDLDDPIVAKAREIASEAQVLKRPPEH